MINLILLNLIVGFNAYILIKYIFDADNNVDIIINFSVIYLAIIIASELFLGILGNLTLNAFFLLNLSLLLFSLILIKVCAISGKRSPLNEIQKALTRIKLSRLEAFCLAAIFGFALVKLAINLMNPPFGWDSLNYHFTFPVEWLKNANLENPIVVSDDPAPSYYPLNGSLFFFWLILPLKNFFLADLGQFPFFIIAFLAVFSLARKLNISRHYSLFAAIAFSLIPNYFKQLEIAYVDIIVAALFLVVLNFIFTLRRNFTLANIILSAVSSGLLLGTKSLAIIYVAILFLPIIIIFIKKLPQIGLKKCQLFLLLFIIILVIFGGFSYFRNFYLAGNPFYPMDVKLFGKVIFKGAIDKMNYGAHFTPADQSFAKLLFHEGLGLQTLLFVLAGVFLGLPVYLKTKKTWDFLYAYFFILPILLYLVFRFVIPLANVRYVYNLLAVGMISGFYVYERARVPFKVLAVIILICVFASVSELSGHWELAWSLIFLLAFYIFFLRNRKLKKIIIITSCLMIVPALFILEKNYIHNEYSRYVKNSPFWPDATKAWKWLNDNTIADNISYVGRPVALPLYGTGLKNNVFYTSVNSIDPVKLHYFKNALLKWNYGFEQTHKNLSEPYNYRGNASEQIWLGNLARRKVGYLFIYSLHQIKGVEFPIEDDWAKNNPDKFNLVFNNNTVHIYRILN